MDRERELLPSVVVATLLVDIDAPPPDAEVSARIRRRVRTRLDEAASMITVRRGSGWRPFFPGAQRKVLSDDGNTLSWMLELAPGVRLPKHRHDDGPEECIVLEGDMWHEGERFGPGDYIIALQGSTHQEAHTVGGALLFFRTPSPRQPIGVS